MPEKLSFQPFDEHGEVRVYYNGFLPHWRQTGCTYFVTFRLADSVPGGVLDEWRYERDKWLAARGINTQRHGWWHLFRDLSPGDRAVFERSFAKKLFETFDQAHGACLLRDQRVAQLVLNACKHFHGQRLDCGDLVVMPNHVHALITPYQSFELEQVLHSIKSYTANQINDALRRDGTVWMKESYDRIVRDGEELIRIQDYIRKNPEKAKVATGQFSLDEAEYNLQL